MTLRAVATNIAAQGVTAAMLPGGVMPTMVVPFVLSSTAGVVWTSMPSAAAFFEGTGRYNTKVDLTNYTQARLIVSMGSTAGATNALIELRYSTTNNQTLANYITPMGSSAITCAINVTAQQVDSGWINLVSGAKADVYIGLTGSGGDGATSPLFFNIMAQFR